MKINNLLFLTLSLFYFNTSQAQKTYLTLQGFEGGSQPSGWEELKSTPSSPSWRYQNGGYTKSIVGHPPSAKTGIYNALFQAEEVGPSTMLITPSMDLSDAVKPALNFWHAQESWSGSTDILKLYYRTSPTSEWVLFQTYTLPTTGWVEREILLPVGAKSATCQIAFEGTTQWGWGVCLDDVQVVERAVLARYVDQINFKQSSNQIASGSKVNPLGYIYVKVLGNDGDVPLNNLIINYTGTSISDVENVSVYHTVDSIFTIDSLITTSISITGNEITITPSSTFNLLTGANFLWICANINASSPHGNKVDYSILSNKISLGANLFPSTDQTPTGQSTIEESVFYDDFESASAWLLNGDWQIGVPTGTGTYDPKRPYQGNNVMATNLSGDYTSNIPLSNPHNAITPSKNLKYYQNINLRYNRFLNVDYFDKARIKVSNDGGTSWHPVFENQLTINDNYWKSVSNSISSFATRKENVKVSIAIDTSNAYTEYGGWNIDNFAITADFIASDVGVKSMVTPISKCGLTSTEVVKVIVKNYGGATVGTPFDVGYSLNNGITWVKESFTLPIDSEEEIEFTFATPADFSVAGLKQLKFKTFLTTDEDISNDTYSKQLYVFPNVSFPYQNSFETSNGHWYNYGINSSWAWGVPSGAAINKASNGTKAWVTNLSLNYNSNEFSYLESPCFNLSGSVYPVISFDYMMQTEVGIDGFAMEYSIDGGITWNALLANANYAHNWYDTPNVSALGKAGWSVNKSSYITAENLLPADAIGVNGVKFRFVFASNSTSSFEGVAIDMVKVYELPNDLSITALTSPVNACEIGNAVKLTFNVKNIGHRPMLNGQTIPIKVKVDNADDVSETLTLAADLNKNDILSFETANNYNLYAAGVHNVNIYTNLAIDDDRANDTLKTQVTVTGMPGYTLGPDIGTTSFPVVLDAGTGYTSYNWYALPDAVTVIGTNQTYSVAAEGDFRVIIENANGCSATDDIKVINSDKNVGVTAISNLSSECTHPSPISPVVTIQHFGTTGIYDGIDKIPLVVFVNGVKKLEEEYTPAAGWKKDDTYSYTFSGTIDLSQKGIYNIAIFTNLSKDLDKSNDSTKTTILTYGEPTVSLPIDTISSTRGDTLKFGVPDDYTGYLWEQKLLGETTWTTVGSSDTLKLNIVSNRLRSATYRITVTDACGTAKDSVFVNAQDLGIFSIEYPSTTICYDPEGVKFKVQIKNFGQDVYPAGTNVMATITTQSSQNNINVTLPELTPGNTTLVTLNDPIFLNPGVYFINVSTSINGDPNPDNDFIENTFTVYTKPTVDIPIDTLFQVFKSTSYLISPNYSADCVSYLWQDASTSSTYLVTNPIYDKYKVTATNANTCSNSDSLIIISTDISIKSIKSPANKCALTENTPVTITISNSGNRTFASGTKLRVKVFVNSTLNSDQEIELTSALAVDESRDITLPGTIDLSSLSNAAIFVEVSLKDLKDVVSTNNTMDKMVYSTGNPVINLGLDREVHSIKEVLSAGGTYDSYAWYKNATLVGNNNTYEATTSGTYSVTVSDFYGCTGSDEVVLTFYDDDISMLTLNTPATSNGCSLGSSEAVNVTIKNTGTWTVPQSTVLELGFFQNNVKKTENYTLTSPLAPNETLEIPMVSTMDFTTKKTHDINVWVKLTNDMHTTNDTLKTQVAAYPLVLVNLGTDIVSNKAEILDPGAGYSSYLWNTGATTQTITVSTTGEYWVEVSNTYGCKAKDFINYTFVAEPDLQLFELNTASSSCTLSNTENVSVKIKNTGNYIFTTGEQINLELQNNGVTVANETLTLTADLLLNTTVDYTFTQKVDLNNPSSYIIKVILTQVKDAQPSNNTLEKSITVWGNPAVNLGNDTTICQGSTLTLNAGNTGTNYLWNTTETTRTIVVSTTGLYWVDVTDSHSCTTRDEIQVNFSTPPTVTHSALNPVCLNSAPITLTGGSPGGGVYTGPGASNVTFTPSAAGAGTHTLTYTYTDAYGCSNSVNVDIKVNPSPVVNLGEDRTTTAPITLDAGSGFSAYLWQDNSTSQTYNVTATGKYSVTVTDGNGCKGYDEVTITFVESVDVYVSSLISPVNKCTDDVGQPVTIEFTNRGNRTFVPGEQIELTYQIGTNDPVKEQYTFAANFPQNGSLQHTFNGNVLKDAGNHTITSYTTFTGNNGVPNSFNVSIYNNPTFSFESDTIRTQVPYVLQAGIGGVTYLWNTGATAPSITVSQHGTYWLRVTNSNGCSTADTVVVWWPLSDEIISGIDAKVNLFPNPVDNELNIWIESQKANSYTIELINPQGAVLLKQQTIKAESVSDKLNMLNFTPGIYFIRVSADKGHATFKIIINR